MKKQKISQTLKHAATAAWKVVSNPKHHKTVLRGIQRTDAVLKGMRHEIHETIEPASEYRRERYHHRRRR